MVTKFSLILRWLNSHDVEQNLTAEVRCLKAPGVSKNAEVLL